ncbi:Rapid alkalinization factor [Acorus gramineus]|uniref:Rapid alkalinization factor n=1 Tax=Acorus gramineus TaxID=55184 RepID=A0AAV9BMW8_ACOGR|nr:Rapid alkalinization factor [Acorus gramineus]
MAATAPPLLALIAAALIIIASTAEATGDHYHHMGWIAAVRRPACDASIGGCLEVGEDEEFAMDSEINRRILATGSYISYRSLKRDSVPCSRRGASYYNCRPGAQANPYSRGCSRITRCRG